MVNDVYMLQTAMKVMRDQRKKLISDFTNDLDVEMMTGLLHFDHSAEFNIYAERYRVVWLDEHWNRLVGILNCEIELEEDKPLMEKYFSRCFLNLIDNNALNNENFSCVYSEILKATAKLLKDLINVSIRCEQNCRELEYASEKHKKKFKEELEKAQTFKKL